MHRWLRVGPVRLHAAALLLPLLLVALERLARVFAVVSLPVIAGLSWLRRDPLAPAPHVEEIVGLAGTFWPGGAVVAIAALLLLPLTFLVARRDAGWRTRLALGVYVSVTCLAPFVGSFPVPVIGYGISPIVGYLLGVGAVLHTASPRE